ncbi:MAG: SDR family oxidoreductase [Myxococcales bacterium]|nr:SDR family oxidoreductase [Myxococcales bacterium]
MKSGLRDRVAWITGASGGIGRATAARFAEEGARLLLHAGSRLPALRAFADGLGLGERCLCVEGDVRDSAAVEAVADEGRRHFGRIDIVVANAGVWPPQDRPLHELSDARIRDVVEINQLGPLFTARAFLRQLAAAPGRHDGASICLVGSTAGRFGERGHVEYAATKAALLGLLRTLKNEIVQLDRRGRVNLVEPGWTHTQMTEETLSDDSMVRRALQTMPLRQVARADDVANAIVFFSSPALARHLSGQTLTVAGGMDGRVLWKEEEIDPGAVRAELDGGSPRRVR